MANRPESVEREIAQGTAYAGHLKKTPFHKQHPWLFRWPPLLFTLFWIADTADSSRSVNWYLFVLFCAVFLLAFLRVFRKGERYPRGWLAVLYVIGYVYFPFNHAIAGEFVFPVVMSVFFLRQPKMSSALWHLALIECASGIGVFVESRLVHVHAYMPENIFFYMVAIGMMNFAYARHILASEQLEQANAEIEHLAQVAERERIARDLHDLLGHTLTVIVLKSDVANRLFAIDPELAHREIAEVEQTARKALAEVREAVSGYRAEGLPAEIAQARRTLASAGVQLTTDVEPVLLSSTEENVLCLMLREAVTNVIRHARATACRLDVHREGNRLRMTVEDNGNGDAGVEGNGLRGMRERFNGCGGTLLRERVKSGGTRLSAEMPLSAPGWQTAPPAHEAFTPAKMPASKGLVQT